MEARAALQPRRRQFPPIIALCKQDGWSQLSARTCADRGNRRWWTAREKGANSRGRLPQRRQIFCPAKLAPPRRRKLRPPSPFCQL